MYSLKDREKKMFDSIESLPWFFAVPIVVISAVLLTDLGYLLIRRLFDTDALNLSNEITGYTFTVVGTFYAVLAGFTILNVQERFDQAHQSVEQEANLLNDLAHDAQVFPESIRVTTKEHVFAYVKHILEIEWRQLANGKISREGHDLIKNIWDIYYSYTPRDEKERIWYAEAVSKLNAISNARLVRIYNSKEHLSQMMWALLIGGAMMTAGFTYLFKIPHVTLHLVVISMLAGTISFMLFLIYCLNTVYSGDVSIKPTAFEKIMHDLNEWS
jgi:hypothetical protein